MLLEMYDAAGQSMRHHLLSSYFHAVLLVALAQFSTKGFVDGIPGVIRLAKASPYVQVDPLGTRLSSLQRCSITSGLDRAEQANLDCITMVT